jgi:hypothetical protein
MSPLPSPEERRKALRTLTLNEVLGKGSHEGRGPRDSFRKSAGSAERERQRAEARHRAKSSSRG